MLATWLQVQIPSSLITSSIALELEKKHPEFKQYAEDIKKFNHNNLNNLKEDEF